MRVSRESGISLKELHELHEQLQNGASAAFLARYRADLCAGRDAAGVREILRKLEDAQDLVDRRIATVATLSQRGVLTDELKRQVEQAADRRSLNDILLPYRAAGSDSARAAVEKRLDPLARALWFQEDGVDPVAEAGNYVDSEVGVESPEAALAGAYEIAARWLAQKPEILQALRELFLRECEVSVTAKKDGLGEPRWKALDGYRAKAAEVPWQKRLAIRRGTRTGVLEAAVEVPSSVAADYLERCLVKDADSAFAPHLRRVVDIALRKRLAGRLKNEALAQIDERADAAAIASFCQRIRGALLAPPAKGLRIMGIETGRSGAWRAVLIDGCGELVDHAVVRTDERAGRDPEAPPAAAARAEGGEAAPDAAPAEDGAEPAAAESAAPSAEPSQDAAEGEPASPAAEASAEPDPPAGPPPDSAPRRGRERQRARSVGLSEFLRTCDADLIVCSTGPRGRSTERDLRAQIRRSGKTGVAWMSVRDSGSWSYAGSKEAKRESPRLDQAFRSALSLARRVQDPLAELVKADPKSLLFGLNHQEVDPDRLGAALAQTVETAVHDAGVDLNSAPQALLSRVPGFTGGVSRKVVEHRKRNGPFPAREALRKVSGMSDRVFAQAVGFVRVYGEDPFDGTGAHPDYRELHERIAAAAGCDLNTLLAEPGRLAEIEAEQFATSERSVECVRAAIREMQPERRNVRGEFQLPEQEVPLRSDDELKPGSKVSGVVRSLADFGAFVDIGADKDALLHISQIRKEHVRDSKPSFGVGDPVEAFVRTQAENGKGIALSMWQPNSGPPRGRNGSGRPGSGRPRDGQRRRDGRGSGGRSGRGPYIRTFGPDPAPRAKGANGRPKAKRMSREEQLDALQDRYRTKV